MYHDKADWQVFENTHEAITDEESLKNVHKNHKSRRRRTDMGGMPMLSGILYCADCGQNSIKSDVRTGHMINTISYAVLTGRIKAAVNLIRSGM